MSLLMRGRSYGFGLLEALIALLMLGIGALGVASLNGQLLNHSGTAKLQAEALHLAQDRFAEARLNAAGGICRLGPVDEIINDTEQVSVGEMSNYKILARYVNPQDTVWGESSFDSDLVTAWVGLEVKVCWPNASGSACSFDEVSENEVVLRSVVNCSGVQDEGRFEQAKSFGEMMKNPTGRGTVGGGRYTGDGSAEDNQVNEEGESDGTKTYNEPNRVILVDSDGEIVLQFDKTTCETGADVETDFSRISGMLFVQAKNGDPIVSEEDLHVFSSDASYCSTLDYNESNWVLPAGASGKQIDFFYTFYQCYVGPEWWGNTGVIRMDNANANDRVCVGHPAALGETGDYTDAPQKSSTRGYRGSTIWSSGIDQMQGIGVTDGGCEYQPVHYENHHFVLANLTGSDSCQSIEETLVSQTDTDTFTANPGKFFCMADEYSECPELTDAVADVLVTIEGEITVDEDATPFEGIDSDRSVCASSTFTGSRYSCTITWEGFTGASWKGAVAFKAGESASSALCSMSMATVEPQEIFISYQINNNTPEEWANAIVFTEVPKAVTSIELDVRVSSGGCQ